MSRCQIPGTVKLQASKASNDLQYRLTVPKYIVEQLKLKKGQHFKVGASGNDAIIYEKI